MNGFGRSLGRAQEQTGRESCGDRHAGGDDRTALEAGSQGDGDRLLAPPSEASTSLA